MIKVFFFVIIHIQLFYMLKIEKKVIYEKNGSISNKQNTNNDFLKTIERKNHNLIMNKIPIEENIKFPSLKTKILSLFEATGTLILSGLFDRSFFITTLMALKYSKTLVLISASFALSVIGVIAVYAGVTINKYIPLIWIESFAVFLFILFGLHMIYDGWNMDEKAHRIKLESEISIEENNLKNSGGLNPEEEQINTKIHVEEEKNLIYCQKENNENSFIVIKKNMNETQLAEKYEENTKNNETIKVFIKVFLLIFFSEIGDRSQISTVYLTISFDKLVVLSAVIMSSIILTILAVFGGKIISNRISEKKLTIFAGALFLIFGIFAIFMLFIEPKN